VHPIKKHTDWITALDISPTACCSPAATAMAASGSGKADSGNEFHTLRAHQAAITAAVFPLGFQHPRHHLRGRNLRFWEMNGGSEVKKIDAHPGGVTAFSFARDGSSLSAGRDLKAKCWKPDFNHARDLSQKLPALPTAAASMAEGKRAFIGDASGKVLVIDTADGKALGEIPSNPPTIATRLATIETQISERKKNLAAAETKLAEQTAARNKAKLALDAAEKVQRQSIEIHKAALEGATQAPNDASKKLVADAAKRIPSAEKKLQDSRTAFEAAEKKHAEATASHNAAKAALAGLLDSRKHWTAAAINTRAIETRQSAQSSATAAEDAQLVFTAAARQVAEHAARLNRKRGERRTLAAAKPSATPEIQAEIAATLAALDLVISRELETLRQSEAALAQAARAIDSPALVAHQKKHEADQLWQAYQKARQ
jgi:hypothetical protein